MSTLIRWAPRKIIGLGQVNPFIFARSIKIKIQPAKPILDIDHDDKNMALKRPQSPHLTIYKPQLTSMTSITHRMTGCALGFYTIAFGVTTLFVQDPPITYYLEYLECIKIGAAPLLAAKFILAFPISFHYCNGLRHLVWDIGKWLTIKEVYTTGWLMIALSLMGTAGLCLM